MKYGVSFCVSVTSSWRRSAYEKTELRICDSGGPAGAASSKRAVNLIDSVGGGGWRGNRDGDGEPRVLCLALVGAASLLWDG